MGDECPSTICAILIVILIGNRYANIILKKNPSEGVEDCRFVRGCDISEGN